MSRRSPLPARYPPRGSWPAVMRADMAAAYLDYRNTGELARAVTRGEAPPPIGDPSRARAELGWAPTLTFEQLVARMVDADLAGLDRSA